jgi:hypothetical protein
VLLRNVPDSTAAGWHFRNETSSSPITDENGMGSSLLDIDNDGNLEWFVTSILDPDAVAAGNWGKTGNRLYSNASTTDQIAFTDITTQAGVGDGYWGWGSCAADFNNDGSLTCSMSTASATYPHRWARTTRLRACGRPTTRSPHSSRESHRVFSSTMPTELSPTGQLAGVLMFPPRAAG